jgi:hypothetical protein
MTRCRSGESLTVGCWGPESKHGTGQVGQLLEPDNPPATTDLEAANGRGEGMGYQSQKLFSPFQLLPIPENHSNK